MAETSTDATNDQTRQHDVLWEMYRGARLGTPPEKFRKHFFAALTSALNAEAACLWICDNQGQCRLLFEWHLKRTELGNTADGWQQHGKLLGHVLRTGKAAYVAPHWSDPQQGPEAQPLNPTAFELLLVPIGGIGGSQDQRAILEIFRAAAAGAQEHHSDLTRLAQFGAFAADYLRGQELQHLAARLRDWPQFDATARRLHASLTPREIAYLLANDGRLVLGCDRVSVALQHGRHCRIEAVSGQETVNPRSNLVRALAELAAVAVRTGEPLLHVVTEKQPPEVIPGPYYSAVEHYHAEATSKTLHVVPLHSQNPSEKDNEPFGALIVEQFEEPLPVETLRERTAFLTAHGSVALSNALAHHQVLLLPLWKGLGSAWHRVRRRTLAKWATILLLLAGIVTASLLIPLPLKLDGEGQLHAVQRRGLFAAEDGIVREVLVKHGDRVSAGQPVLVLENTDLAMRLRQMAAEQIKTREQLRAKEVERGHRDLTEARKIELEGERLQLQATLDHLEQQIELLKQRLDLLTVRATMDGVIVTWEPEQQLLHRPVQRGHLLLFEVNDQDDWQLEINVPEDRVGYLNRYRDQLAEGERVRVEYMLATQPESRFAGWVAEIAPQAIVSEHGSAVRVTVDLDPRNLPPLREGAAVRARFWCGRRSAAFVCLRELIEFVQTHLWW